MLPFDQYDPDEWMAAGNNLLDYPYPPDGGADQRPMLRAIEGRPKLHAHLQRWFRVSLEFNRERGGNGLADKLTEDEARLLWEETRHPKARGTA
jgi:hypothetical protein